MSLSKLTVENQIFTNEKFKENSDGDENYQIHFNKELLIWADKSLLQERSTFFLAMRNFKESGQEMVDVYFDISLTSFKQLMNYLANGKLEVSSNNLDDITRAANYFQLNVLLKFCQNVFKLHINLQTVGYIWEFSQKNFLSEISKVALKFVVKHFHKIWKSKDFLHWTVDSILELLSSDEIIVSHEKKVLRFALDWLNFNAPSPGELATAIFRTLRFSFLETKEMKEIAQLHSGGQHLTTLLDVASEFSDITSAPRTFHRGIYMFVTVLSDLNSCLIRYSPTDGNVTRLKLPKQRGCEDLTNAKWVVKNSTIYRVSLDKVEKKLYVDTFDPITNTCISGASPQLNIVRAQFDISICYCMDKIVVFIPNVEDDRRSTVTLCMTYCIETDTWQTLKNDILSEQCIMSATVFGDSIYLVVMDSTNLFHFQPSTNECNEVPFQSKMCFCQPIVHQSKILFFPRSPNGRVLPEMVVFNPDGKLFQKYSVTDFYTKINVDATILKFASFKGSIYMVETGNKLEKNASKIWKLDLSFQNGIRNTPELRLRFIADSLSEIELYNIYSICSIDGGDDSIGYDDDFGDGDSGDFVGLLRRGIKRKQPTIHTISKKIP